jgi:hypothetical protein
VFLHDDFWLVGARGSEEEMRYAISRLPPTGDIDGCLGAVRAHWASMFRRLTAHDAGGDAEDWHRWWALHRNETQAEWIRKAFLPIGIDPTVKPSATQVRALLRLIGLHHRLGYNNHMASVHVGDELEFNAMRILRDHRIDPSSLWLDGASAEDARLILQGLIEYTKFWADNSASSGAGVVFGGSVRPAREAPDHPMFEEVDHAWELEPWFFWVSMVGSGTCLLLGTWLARRLWLSRRRASAS